MIAFTLADLNYDGACTLGRIVLSRLSKALTDTSGKITATEEAVDYAAKLLADFGMFGVRGHLADLITEKRDYEATERFWHDVASNRACDVINRERNNSEAAYRAFYSAIIRAFLREMED